MWIKMGKDKFIGLSCFWVDSTLYSWDSLVQVANVIPRELTATLEKYGFFWVDEKIINLIAYLNLKGFKTIACCSGHEWHDPYGFYVMFDGIVDVSKLGIPNELFGNLGLEVIEIANNTRIGVTCTQFSTLNFILNGLEAWCSSRINGIKYQAFALDNSHIPNPDESPITFYNGE